MRRNDGIVRGKCRYTPYRLVRGSGVEKGLRCQLTSRYNLCLHGLLSNYLVNEVKQRVPRAVSARCYACRSSNSIPSEK